MAVGVNNIPSINLPLTNEQGIIHPVWYEFFRSVIANLGATSGGTSATNTVIAGSGIVGTGAVSTVNVGAGQGIAVGADSVSVDILNQVNVQAAVEDEILISDASSGSAIKKTSLRDVAALSVANPGGSTTQFQYNSNGTFAGDTGFTTNGAGNLTIGGELALSSTASYVYWTGGSSTTYCIRGDGGTPIIQGPSTAYQFSSTAAGWSMTVGAGLSCVWSASTAAMTMTALNLVMSGTSYIRRSVNATITASTTQTQGQGALTRDINEISTCANANDTVTLPTAVAGQQCLVINNGANTLQVFPASGDNLGAGLNTSTTIVSGSRKLFVAFDTTNWEPVI